MKTEGFVLISWRRLQGYQGPRLCLTPRFLIRYSLGLWPWFPVKIFWAEEENEDGIQPDSISSPPRSSWRQSSQNSISRHPAHCGEWHLLLSAAPTQLHFILPSPRLRRQTWAYPCSIKECRLSKCLITEFPEIPMKIFYLDASVIKCLFPAVHG